MVLERKSRENSLALSKTLSAQKIADIVDFFVEEIQLTREPLNLRLRAAVDVEVQFAPQTILGILSILTHHDHRCLNSGEQREKQVK